MENLLEEFLMPMNISQNGLARAIGVSSRRINEIVLGKRATTTDTALRLAKALGASVSSGWDCRTSMGCGRRRGLIVSQLDSIQKTGCLTAIIYANHSRKFNVTDY